MGGTGTVQVKSGMSMVSHLEMKLLVQINRRAAYHGEVR